MTTWAIKDWDSLFQKSDLRDSRVKTWKYVPMPINLLGERYRTLAGTAKGLATIGVFLALCEVAANLPKRGVLADERGPLTLRALSIKTAIPERLLSSAITLLASPEIGWLVAESARQSSATPAEEPAQPAESARPFAALPQPSVAYLNLPQPQPDSAEPAERGAAAAAACAALTAEPWPAMTPRKAQALSADPSAVHAALRRARNRMGKGEKIGAGLLVDWITNGDAALWAKQYRDEDLARTRKGTRVGWGLTGQQDRDIWVSRFQAATGRMLTPDAAGEDGEFLDWIAAQVRANAARGGAA